MNININRVKIFVTIPLDSVEKVREAVCNAGAGVIGEYTFCTSSTKSLGTFIPSENANPHIGERNKLEFVEEEKLEVMVETAFKKGIAFYGIAEHADFDILLVKGADFQKQLCKLILRLFPLNIWQGTKNLRGFHKLH